MGPIDEAGRRHEWSAGGPQRADLLPGSSPIDGSMDALRSGAKACGADQMDLRADKERIAGELRTGEKVQADIRPVLSAVR